MMQSNKLGGIQTSLGYGKFKDYVNAAESEGWVKTFVKDFETYLIPPTSDFPTLCIENFSKTLETPIPCTPEHSLSPASDRSPESPYRFEQGCLGGYDFFKSYREDKPRRMSIGSTPMSEDSFRSLSSPPRHATILFEPSKDPQRFSKLVKYMKMNPNQSFTMSSIGGKASNHLTNSLAVYIGNWDTKTYRSTSLMQSKTML